MKPLRNLWRLLKIKYHDACLYFCVRMAIRVACKKGTSMGKHTEWILRGLDHSKALRELKDSCN